MPKKIGDTLQNKYKLSRYDWIVLIVILTFFCLNFMTLMAFPTVHSDELWLKGIATEMLDQGRFDVTEPFYDLYPRVIHPFRWLYNGLLIIALKIYDPSVVAVRLVALIFGTLCLPLVYKITRTQFQNPLYGIAVTTLLCLNIQFVYSVHMGRQETIILFLLLLGYWWLIKSDTKHLIVKLTLLILLGMGVHPNSFILGICFAGLLLLKGIMREAPLSKLFKLLGLSTIGVTFYVLIGTLMNPTFIKGYMNYGSALGVDAEVTNRFEGFYWYWYKLFHQIGGTYDLFDIKGALILFVILSLIWLPILLTVLAKVQLRKTTHFIAIDFYPLITLTGIALSFLLIGRYNQTAIVFIMPFVLLLMLQSVDKVMRLTTHKRSPITLAVLVIILAGLWGSNLWKNLTDYASHRFYSLSYEDMLKEISHHLPADAVVLGNLNIIEAFNPNHFYDIRNLGYLDPSSSAFQEYVESRNIEYIVLHEEMDYIARTSPKWDFLYVNIVYYDAMQLYLKTHTQRIYAFENPLYAMRISKFSGTYPWQTVIYKVVE